MRRVKGDLRLDLDARLGHARPQALLAELVKRLLAFPGVNVVAVPALPPRQVGDAAVRRFLEPADGLRLLQDLRRSLLDPPRQLPPRTVTASQAGDTTQNVSATA